MGTEVELGDIVLYRVTADHRRPAIVTHVWGDTCVNLHIFMDGSHPDEPINGMHTSVPLGPAVGEWTHKD